MLHFKESVFTEKCELSEACQCLAVITFFRTHSSVKGSHITRQKLRIFHKIQRLVSSFACPYPVPYEQISPHAYTIFI